MDDKLDIFKEEMVAKSYTQNNGVYYDETFSPISMLNSLRMLIAITTL